MRLHLSEMKLEKVDNHHGMINAGNIQCTRMDDHDLGNFANTEKNLNLYYQGDFDGSTDADGRSRVNELCPDLETTNIVTSIQNVYYEI